MTVKSLLVGSLLPALVITGCKGKPKHQDPGGKAEAPSKGSGSGGMQPSPDLPLPKSAATAPDKTTKPLDSAMLEKLRNMTFDRFYASPRGNDKTMTVMHTTQDFPKVKAIVTIQSCEVEPCIPMDVDKWKAKADDIKRQLPEVLKSAPDTVFELNQTDINGAPAIYTYVLGQAVGTGSGEQGGGPGGAFIDAYTLFYNDGVNQIRVIARYADDPVKTKEDMAKAVSKEDLERVAKSFTSAYTHAWTP